MAQYIKQANIFGRLGTGIGKGLSEQIPKEIERSRLAGGLKELNEQKDLSPQEYFTRALSVPGLIDRPQAIQSLAELAKQQGQRNSLRNSSGKPTSSADPKVNELLKQASALQGRGGQSPDQIDRHVVQGERVPQGNIPQGQPQIVEKNPLSPELQAAPPWSPEEIDAETSRVWENNPYLTRQEARDMALQNEARQREAPEVYRKQQQQLEEVQEKVNAEIESQLRKKLQVPKNQEVWDKLTGESHNRIERGVSRDLRKNPNANVKDLVNTWTDRALTNGKAKTSLKGLANRTLDEKIFKKSENLDKLRSIGKTFRDFGNSEEYYNLLKSDFDLSPEGASSIAYPLSKTADSYVKNIKESNFDNFDKNSIKYANDLGDYLTRNDSILSIAKNIKEKDSLFDIKSFLSEIRSLSDEIGLTDAQKNEIDTHGIADIFPNWGDIFLFPRIGKGL